MKVIKRNGNTEPYMVEKTKKVIAWMCEDLDVNPLWLEAVYSDALKDQMTTDEMHNTLIYKTITLASAKHPEWVFAAGRGRTMTLWKKTQAYEKTFSTFVRDMVKNGHYHKPFFDMYTDEELDSLDRVIDQRRDLDHSYSSVVTFENKSLLEGECIQQLFMANALVIATVEPKESRLDFAIEVYKALSMRKISLATPWLLNLRRGRNISSCFVISINDDLESIYNNLKRAAFISKNGGGVGIDFSNIRAKGASVAGSPNASGGVVGWIKLYNDTAIAVNQEGKRAGAFTCNLAIWHRDIEDFLEIQTEVGDMRKKSFDIKPQITNYDLFMETVDKNGTWYTFCPFEVKQTLNLSIVGVFGQDFNRVYESCVTAYKNGVLKNVGEYPAKELLKKWMKVQFETGMPYMTFVDRLNEFNPNKHDGFIPCLNLCTESSSNVVPDLYGHTCNLASIVMGRMNDYDDIEYHASLLCHVLDNGIDLTKTPTEISKAHNERYRTIGIGIQGLHDWLVKNDTNYHNIQECVRVAEVIEYGALKESIKLAKVRGAYPAYKGSMWDDGSLTARFARHSVAGKNWEEMQIGLNKYGCRNSQMTSPPPNTSTSIAMDAVAGVMPVYSPFFVEDNKNGSLPVAAMFLKEKPLGYAKTMAMYDQKLLSAVVGGMQVFIDTGISAEYILDQNKEGFSAKDLYDLIFAAWRNNTKAIYYVRTVKRGTKIDDLLGIKSSTDCVACAG